MTSSTPAGRPTITRAMAFDAGVITLAVALAIASISYTSAVAAPEYADKPSYKVWQLLVMLQIVVWAVVAVLNARNLRLIRATAPSDRSPWLALGAVYGLILLILIPAHGIGLIASKGSKLGTAGTLLQVLGLSAVLPAFISLHAIYAAAIEESLWESTSQGLDLMRFLRRRVRPAVASIGLVIALAIVTVSQAQTATSSSTTEDQIPGALLYGGFFTAILFVVYTWVDAALDERSRSSIRDLVDPSDPSNWDEFEATEKKRTTLETAYGIGKSS